MKPRVLFISHDTGRSGAPILLLHLLKWLHAHGDLEIRTLSGYGGALEPEYAALGPSFVIHPPQGHAPGRVRRVAERLRMVKSPRVAYEASLRNRLAAEPIDLIYVNTLACGPELEFVRSAVGLQCPVVCHVHELEYAIRRLGDIHTEQVFQAASRYVVVSEAVRENLILNHAVAPEAIEVVYGFVPTASEAAERDECRRAVRAELELPEHTQIVVGGGSTEWRKGSDLFLYLAKASRERLPKQPLCFLWVGGRPTDSYFQELLSDLRGLGLEGYVRFIGQRPDPIRYFAASDVFALTSREDPFPLVALEAAAVELPIICFAGAGGTPEFVGRECGVSVPYLDWNAMADALTELLCSPALRAAYGAAAREKVRRENSVEAGSRQILQLIRRQSAPGATRPPAAV